MRWYVKVVEVSREHSTINWIFPHWFWLNLSNSRVWMLWNWFDVHFHGEKSVKNPRKFFSHRFPLIFFKSFSTHSNDLLSNFSVLQLFFRCSAFAFSLSVDPHNVFRNPFPILQKLPKGVRDQRATEEIH